MDKCDCKGDWATHDGHHELCPDRPSPPPSPTARLEHSKLPWHVTNRAMCPIGTTNSIRGADGLLVADFQAFKDDAHLAVEAVNSHDSLQAERDALKARADGLQIRLDEEREFHRSRVVTLEKALEAADELYKAAKVALACPCGDDACKRTQAALEAFKKARQAIGTQGEGKHAD